MKKIFIVLLVLFSVNANSQEGFTPPEEIGIYEKA
jgi:hypothetical protein